MNVTFSDTEMLQLYELLVKSNADESLIEKVRKPILAVLEREHKQQTKDAFASWSIQETKKIEELSKKNESLLVEKPNKFLTKKR
jgi:hypothetical protein